MTTGKLTRQELSWLLTQEAQGAADRLRMGVQILKSNIPPPPAADAEQAGVPTVDSTLDALDETMRMLSSLHKVPLASRARRGRIDLAALLWDVAPDAKVSMEPGCGTEIHGDEGEIRRMMHLLVGHGSDAGSAVTVRRDGDDVRVSVVLGPDSSATTEIERAWLARMAVRYGGKYEIEGGMEVITLPADGAADAKERDVLRKELDEARKQGEAYARELAQVFAAGEGSVPTSTFPPMSQAPSAEPIGTLARFSRGVAAMLKVTVTQARRDLQALRPSGASVGPRLPEAEVEERFEGLRRRLRDVSELMLELADLGDLEHTEARVALDLVEVTRGAVKALAAQLERAGVEVKISTVPDTPGLQIPVRMSPRATAFLVRTLIAQAIVATPRGREVEVRVVSCAPGDVPGDGAPPFAGARLLVDDAGPALPATARRSFVGLEVDPSTFARANSVSLFICSELAAWQGALLDLGDAPLGGLRVGLHLPRVVE